MGLGAKGVINRKDFKCWGQLPTVNTPEYKTWLKEARKFGKAIWDITGKGVNVDMVFEHPGEATFPVSTFVVQEGRHGGDLRGHHGFNCTFDVRYMWMHQKRLQGSHFAHLKQASAANRLMVERRLDPCMSEVFWCLGPRSPPAHMKMRATSGPGRAQAGQHGRAGAGPGTHRAAHFDWMSSRGSSRRIAPDAKAFIAIPARPRSP
jgi:crotonyl-CoA carboxylase/reductase